MKVQESPPFIFHLEADVIPTVDPECNNILTRKSGVSEKRNYN